jgi:hypothetical protein
VALSSSSRNLHRLDSRAVAADFIGRQSCASDAENNVFALMAAILLLANLVIFYFFTYPVNVETANWTVMPDNWEVLRGQWSYVMLSMQA